MPKLAKGDKAPELGLLDQNGKKVALKDFKGKKLLVYFYPKANTSGCTKQSCSVSESMPNLKKLGIAAVGISPDAPDEVVKAAHKVLARKYHPDNQAEGNEKKAKEINGAFDLIKELRGWNMK